VANFELLTLQSGKQKRQNSNQMAVDFSSLAIGADALSIAQGGTGASAYFDFSARALRSSHSPNSSSDLVNKAYADNLAAGIKWKDSVRALAFTNITLSGEQTIDDVPLVAGDRVACIGQSPASANGIYIVVDSGSWTRAFDFNDGPEVVSAAFFIEEGTEYGDSAWVCTTNAPITIDSTSLVFAQFAGGGTVIAGAGMTKTGNTLDVVSADNSMTINADSIQVKLNVAGAIEVTGTGLAVKLEASNPSLQIASNELGVKLDGSGAIVKGASGVAVQLEASNASLQIASNQLGVKVSGSGAILKGASGLEASVDSGVAGSVKISSNKITVDHAVTRQNDNASTISALKVVLIKPNGNFDLAEKSSSNLDLAELGITEEAIASAASGKVILRRGAIVDGFSSLVPGERYFVNNNGDISKYSDITFFEGEFVYSIGRALSATQILFNPNFEFEY
jgi:hypothetical protein